MRWLTAGESRKAPSSPERPRGRVALAHELDLVVPDADEAVTGLDREVEGAEHRVVLQEMRHRLRVADVVHGDDLEVPATLDVRAQEIAPDAAEAVDAYACLGHVLSLSPCQFHKPRQPALHGCLAGPGLALRRQLAKRHCGMLPPQRRLVVFLRYFADMSYGEIGEVLGIAEGTVAASLSQAHEQLGSELSTQEATVPRAQV